MKCIRQLSKNKLSETGKKICVIGAFSDDSKHEHPLILSTRWENLQNKRILNDNVLICHYGDVHPYPRPPIFPNVKNVYLFNNYKYWHYYWLNVNIFSNNPRIHLHGHPCDSPVLNRGFEMDIVGDNHIGSYRTAVRYANEIGADTSLLKEISEKEFFDRLSEFEVEEVVMDDYHQDHDEFKKDLDPKMFTGIYSESLLKNAKW